MSCICTQLGYCACIYYIHSLNRIPKNQAPCPRKKARVKTQHMQPFHIHRHRSVIHGFTHAWGSNTKEFPPFKTQKKYPS